MKISIYAIEFVGHEIECNTIRLIRSELRSPDARRRNAERTSAQQRAELHTAAGFSSSVLRTGFGPGEQRFFARRQHARRPPQLS